MENKRKVNRNLMTRKYLLECLSHRQKLVLDTTKIAMKTRTKNKGSLLKLAIEGITSHPF